MTTAPTTGPEAVMAALKAMNIDDLEDEQKAVIKSGKTTKRPRAVRLLNAIHGLRVNKIEPSQLMISSVPVTVSPLAASPGTPSSPVTPTRSTETCSSIVASTEILRRSWGAMGPPSPTWTSREL